jgi:peptidoglycan/xylan/chitin deacetylase (PgdA/CDA1 family)
VPRPTGAQGGLTVVNWAGFKGAVSYTFDDANSSQINNWTALKNLNVRMTWYLQTNKSEASNNVWAQALSLGHELGNHTQSHPQTANASDIDACTSFIQSHFGVTPLTMAAPYGDSSYISPASSRFLINRGVNGGSIAPNGNTDPFNINCNIPAQNASASAINSPIDQARTAGNWAVILVHGFTGGSDGAYQPVDINQFTSSVNTVKGYGDMWIDTVLNIGAYWRAQKMLSSVSPTTSGSDKIYNWTLPSHFPTGKYLRVKVTGGTLKQNGNVLSWDSHGYYEIALDARSLTISP